MPNPELSGPEPSQSREVSPFTKAAQQPVGFKDFRPIVVKSDTVPVAEVEPEPVDPKEESAPESAPSSTLQTNTEQPGSETPVPEPAGKENGSNSEESEPSTSEPLTVPGSSSLLSSGPTNPGWNEPPVPVVPPTSGKTPKQ